MRDIGCIHGQADEPAICHTGDRGRLEPSRRGHCCAPPLTDPSVRVDALGSSHGRFAGRIVLDPQVEDEPSPVRLSTAVS